ASRDVEGFEDRNAGRSQCRERATETGDGNLSKDEAENRQLQQQPVDDSPAVVGLVVAANEEDEAGDPDHEEDEVAGQEVGGRDQSASGEGRPGNKAREEGRERRNALEKDDRDDDRRDDDDRDGVDQSGADLGPKFDGLLDVGREALQDRVQNTARL